MFPISKIFFKLSIVTTDRKGAFTEVGVEQEENKSKIQDGREFQELCI